jgi:acyl-CoA synthetase (NDP forming)
VSDPVTVASEIGAAARNASGKPVLATFMSAKGAPPEISPLPCYPFPESAAAALARVTAYGAKAADEAALRDILLRVSALFDSCPEVLELDLNPVKVLGDGARVVDARVRVGRPPSTPGSRPVSY